MSILQIQKRLESMLSFMEVHWDFVNCHMVNYLTDDHWTKYVPHNVQQNVASAQSVQQCIDTVFWKKFQENQQNQFPFVTEFLKTTQEHTCAQFPELITCVEELQKILEVDVTSSLQKLTIKEFLTEKKQHEVETAAALINELIESKLMKKYDDNSELENVYIIDAGDGKGYLSSRLALQYNFKVLGIDANPQNTENALKRNSKLQRAWAGLTERALLLDAGIKPPRRGKKIKKSNVEKEDTTTKQTNYRTAAQFITTDVNLLKLLHDYFENITANPMVCLTGLHTCGNLAATCLKLFHAQPLIQIVCNIGCCYHLLKETYSERDEFSNTTLMNRQTHDGFPLSRYLNERQLQIGRNARMLACQSLERTLVAQELPNISLYYRALLEVLLKAQNNNYQNAQVGKLRRFENFQQYVCLSMQKLNLNYADITDNYIAKLEHRYKDHLHYLNLFYLLRQCFAPVLESLILLDRLLYLKELGYEKSFLVPIFNAVTSPRHFGIIAFK